MGRFQSKGKVPTEIHVTEQTRTLQGHGFTSGAPTPHTLTQPRRGRDLLRTPTPPLPLWASASPGGTEALAKDGRAQLKPRFLTYVTSRTQDRPG